MPANDPGDPASDRTFGPGNTIVLTEATASAVTASGAGVLAGGSDTGGVESSTDLAAGAGFTLKIKWYKKAHTLSPK